MFVTKRKHRETVEEIKEKIEDLHERIDRMQHYFGLFERRHYPYVELVSLKEENQK